VSEEAEMCFIGKLSRGKRGVGSIIGATFLVLILLTGYTFYFLNVDVSADYSKTLEDMQELDQKRNKENIEFTTVSFNQDGKLNITVKNTGSQQTHFIWLGIVDETANTQKYYAIDSYVDPAETVPDIRNETITIFEGQDRVIQLVTELGNTFTYNYPLSEEESTDTYDFVDNDTSNKDDSDDIGAHSLFSAEQAGPDGIVDGLTEGDTGGAVENDVDSNGSDEDGSADIGTETNFSYATGTSLDSNYMNTQEANTGTSGSSEWLDCNTFDSDRTGWEEVGSSPYLGAQDYPSNYIWSTTNNRMERYFYFPSTTLTGTLSVTISIYCNNDDGAGDDKADVYVDYTGSGTGSYVGSVAQHTNWQYDTIDLGSHTVSEVNNLRVYFRYNGEGSADDVRIDHVRIGVNSPASPNYEIDFEYKWTSAAYSSDNEEVCIYVAAHTGSETLSVNYWSGSWTSLGTITSTGWNNFTATGLTSPTYTIRLVGTTESSDSDQDDWDIDLVTLHTWNASNYELDLEVQWTGVDYDETNEWLSIYGGTMGAEDILVDVWNGTAWINLFTDLSSGWNSVDVSSYLVSSTFTIRFRDAVGDATDDRWEIDTAFLYVWS
jgi:hypothetical protein